MTRDECVKVLQALWRYKDCEYSEHEVREALEIAINEITRYNSLYKTRPEIMDWQTAGWIPVNKRLPETTGRYLAYIVNKHDDRLRYIMTCDYLLNNYWHWYPDDEDASDNVVAWQPLPAPYKVESEGK